MRKELVLMFILLLFAGFGYVEIQPTVTDVKSDEVFVQQGDLALQSTTLKVAVFAGVINLAQPSFTEEALCRVQNYFYATQINKEKRLKVRIRGDDNYRVDTYTYLKVDRGFRQQIQGYRIRDGGQDGKA